ncbi:MAG TPA: glycosyltransferase family 87 protein [Anaerolineaceae bacterium]|nr:hypothetical protein [Bacteroidota bacterium]HOQ68373.1 glycosyltransferase family 87 protein [Anaerolineaceae bacterium]HUM63916.1 glycosyltransferase family 87 protein [Anaerolineaceae bacterium]
MKNINWKPILLITIGMVYFGMIIISIKDPMSPIHYGGDYIAFWSAGKVANEYGYSKVYDMDLLGRAQFTGLYEIGYAKESQRSTFTTLPAPFLSFYLVPFQFLSRINNIELSYWIWCLCNIVVLVTYLLFFLRRVIHPGLNLVSRLIFLLLSVISFSVFDNFVNGQVNIFMMVCCGEFIRNTVGEKPFLSGVWLAGLLMKPQMLILILPLILIMRYWKVFWGFVITAGFIGAISCFLSGLDGFIALIKLWVQFPTEFGGYNAVTGPEMMINWRMIGLNTNRLLNSSGDWVITFIGIAITITVVILIMETRPIFGSPRWVVSMLGVFSATLAVTWHSHYHMALVLIPLLIYSTASKLIPEIVFYLFSVITPLSVIGSVLVYRALHFLMTSQLTDETGMVIAVSGFLMNMVIVYWVFRNTYMVKVKEEAKIEH